MSITVTVYKSICDLNARRNGEVVTRNTQSEIYEHINKTIAHKIPDFYAWNRSPENGASLAPMLGAWD